MRIRLETPVDALNSLRAMAEGRGQQVRIRKDQLSCLLIDHHRMFNALRSAGVPVDDSGKEGAQQ